jgi:hypothetical protein
VNYLERKKFEFDTLVLISALELLKEDNVLDKTNIEKIQKYIVQRKEHDQSKEFIFRTYW